jgi:Mn-dependent DtxR family transcriptional regulator
MTAKEISAILGVDTMTSQDQCRRMFKQGCVERIETGRNRLYAYKLNGGH